MLLIQRSLSLNKAMLRQILILRLVSQKPRLKWCFLSNCQKDTLAIIYNDGFNNVLINSGVDQVRKLVKADKMAFIVLGFITRLPFREIATASPLAMPRNDIKCVAQNNVKKVCRFCYYFSANKLLLYSVRSTLSF